MEYRKTSKNERLFNLNLIKIKITQVKINKIVPLTLLRN